MKKGVSEKLKREEEVVLKIRDLSLGYSGEKGMVIAVDNVSLDIPKGKISSIVGESGSGKSTLANAIIGFIKYPATKIEGSIEYKGQNILELTNSKLNKIRMKNIAFVPQAAMNSLNPVMKIGDEIHDIIEAHTKVTPSEEKDMVERALHLVDLPEYIVNSYQNQISGGMKQRVMIAIATLLDPEIIIMDEPTTGLDVIVQKSILDSIKRINNETGKTIILITHDLPVAFYVSHYTSILYSGKIIEEGLTADVVANKLHPYTELLIGSIPSSKHNKKRLVTIKGSVKPMFESTSKCTFVNRCTYAIDSCNYTDLQNYYIKDEIVKCLKYDEKLKLKFDSSIKDSESDTPPLINGIVEKLYSKETHKAEMLNAVKEFTIGRGSNRRYIKAVNNVDIIIESGRITGLVGGSGSGKTTVGKLFLFDEFLTKGKYLFDDVDITNHRSRQRRKYREEIQMIFQDPFSSLSPIHNIGYQIERPLLINKLSKREAVKKDVLEMLDLVGLRPSDSFINKYPYELSGGQRQRVCIAKALSVGAKLLVADEPVSMLDASVRAEILNLLVDLKKYLNLGILYITHDLSTVGYVADDVYVMHKGKIVEYGKTETVLSSPRDGYTKTLFESIV
jgi:peptide/nickel transport system ATP-binding protein